MAIQTSHSLDGADWPCRAPDASSPGPCWWRYIVAAVTTLAVLLLIARMPIQRP